MFVQTSGEASLKARVQISPTKWIECVEIVTRCYKMLQNATRSRENSDLKNKL